MHANPLLFPRTAGHAAAATRVSRLCAALVLVLAPAGPALAQAAAQAQPAWAAAAPRERAEVLRRSWELLTERGEDLARLITRENGKVLAEARGEITYAAEFFRWFSEEAVRIEGRYAVPPGGAGRMLTMKQPVGPCLFITPWNFPMAMGTRKIGPAIAAGCTMVVKPAGLTPLTMLALADLLTEAGLPEGVLNVVTTSSTSEVMEPLIEPAKRVCYVSNTLRNVDDVEVILAPS